CISIIGSTRKLLIPIRSILPRARRLVASIGLRINDAMKKARGFDRTAGRFVASAIACAYLPHVRFAFARRLAGFVVGSLLPAFIGAFGHLAAFVIAMFRGLGLFNISRFDTHDV